MPAKQTKNQPGSPRACGCGSHHLVPFHRQTSENFELALHSGKLIANLGKTAVTNARDANHMRDADYVVGLLHKGQARAYPLWICDYYHIINDKLAGDPVIFVTCERCQSGAGYIAELDGKPLRFSAQGMYNATLLMRDLRPHSGKTPASTWLHYEGVAIDGPQQGTFLEQIPAWHMSWGEWRAAFPETDVMLPPLEDHHPDERHGHGREEYFSRPGMDLPLVQTIHGTLDDRYPENEMVLGVNFEDGLMAWPLREVKKAGGVVNDNFCGVPLVVFAGPAAAQATMAAFETSMDGNILGFVAGDGCYIDEQTQSRWSVFGEALDGAYKGRHLKPLRWNYVRWHAWVYPHRETGLYLYNGEVPCPGVDTAPVQPVLDALAGYCNQLYPECAVINLRLPHEADYGVSVLADHDRLNIYRFTSASAATDYAAFQGAWHCPPIGLKIERKFSVQAGRFVVESDPPLQYADPARIVRLPDKQVQWSGLVTGDTGGWTKQVAAENENPAETGFSQLIEGLKQSRIDVVEVAFVPHSQLRPGSVNAIAAKIENDRFIIYKTADPETARAMAGELSHSLCAGCFVFRSTPDAMYEDMLYEIGQLPTDKVRWSRLVKNARFKKVLESCV